MTVEELKGEWEKVDHFQLDDEFLIEMQLIQSMKERFEKAYHKKIILNATKKQNDRFYEVTDFATQEFISEWKLTLTIIRENQDYQVQVQLKGGIKFIRGEMPPTEHEEKPVKCIYTDHSNPVQKIFGTYGANYPIDNVTRDIATNNEFIITEVDGKRVKNPKQFLLSAECVNEIFSKSKLNALDQAVYNLVSSTYLAGNRFFTLSELWGEIFDPYSCKGTTAERLRESIEKLSSIRIQAETTDNNGNPVKINQNLLYTKGETRIQASNKKAVTGYLLLAAPAFLELTQANNQIFGLDKSLYDYGSNGKQIRSLLIVCAFLRRIELQKYTYKSEIERAQRKALSKAKSDERNKANAEGRAASNKHLDTYKYYTAPADRFRTVKIKFDELCKEVECKELSKISKDVKVTIKKEVELCLNHYKEIGYIESFELPAANHNKTAEVIIKLNKDINKPYVITDSRAKQREQAKKDRCCK